MAIFGKLWMSSVIQNKYFPLSYYGVLNTETMNLMWSMQTVASGRVKQSELKAQHYDDQDWMWA